ncbi:unnamed protein product, partial [Owenia fusiformis]
ITVTTFFALAVVGQALTPSSYFTTVDQARLRRVFESAQPFNDLATAHYSILGLKLLGVPVPKASETCSFLKKRADVKSVESIFFASSASSNLGSCDLGFKSVDGLLNDAIKDNAAVVTIYQAVLSLKNLGLTIDSKKVSSALNAALKNDDSPTSGGYSFFTASFLSGDVNTFFENIEDIVAQAEEIDEKYLQFEGGLFTTALVIDGAYKLAAKAKKQPTLSPDKVLKFTNYFLSRKHVHQIKSASMLLSVLNTLTSNDYHIPVAVTLASQVSVSDKNPTVQVRVTNLMGKSLGKLTVTADSAKNVGDNNAVVLSKKPFTASKSDDSLYELNFMQAKVTKGFYQLTISVAPTKKDARFIGITGAEIGIKVTTQVAIENVDIGIADKDQSSAAKTIKLQHPNKAANVMEVDHHQKIIMKFQLKDKSTSKAMTAHQTFVRLTNQKTKQEIIFVAEADSSDNYKFDLDVGASAKDFGRISGKYSMELIVGDAVIENPFSWLVADVKLVFPEGSAPKPQEDVYSKKPEIKHLFNVPEKRPPAIVSNVFTVLVFVPVLLLLALWVKIGVNISNFPVSLSAVGFHVGLGAIFVLYYLYWTQLNMFVTVKYLCFIGVPTFLFGNRLLSSIASKRK